MDELTTSAVTLVRLDDPDLVETWFTAMCQTYDEVADSEDVWAGFVEAFPAAADLYVGSGTAASWIEGMEDLTTDPASLLASLADQRDELASAYWAETEETVESEPAEPEAVEEAVEVEQGEWEAVGADEATADPFAWVHAQPELVARVEGILQYRPEHYESHLGPYLEQLWGVGWEQHPDEHKQVWLGQALDGLEPTADTQAASAEAPESTEVESTEAESTQAESGEAELAEVEQQVADALTEALAEVPEAAALSDEEIAEVLAEVLAEQSASESV